MSTTILLRDPDTNLLTCLKATQVVLGLQSPWRPRPVSVPRLLFELVAPNSRSSVPLHVAGLRADAAIDLTNHLRILLARARERERKRKRKRKRKRNREKDPRVLELHCGYIGIMENKMETTIL